jgi:hypothetical protein
MNSFVPPVVDHAKRSTIEMIKARSPFSVLNIVALVAILIIGYFLYKKFRTKFSSGAIKMPQRPRPVPPKKVSFKKPVIVEESESETDDEAEDEEEVPDVEVKED